MSDFRKLAISKKYVIIAVSVFISAIAGIILLVSISVIAIEALLGARADSDTMADLINLNSLKGELSFQSRGSESTIQLTDEQIDEIILLMSGIYVSYCGEPEATDGWAYAIINSRGTGCITFLEDSLRFDIDGVSFYFKDQEDMHKLINLFSSYLPKN